MDKYIVKFQGRRRKDDAPQFLKVEDRRYSDSITLTLREHDFQGSEFESVVIAERWIAAAAAAFQFPNALWFVCTSPKDEIVPAAPVVADAEVPL